MNEVSAPFLNAVILEAQSPSIPKDVKDEIRRLWANAELGNDWYYYPWSDDDFYTSEDETEDEEYRYPIIARYLRSNNIDECLIHFWW